ncbi:MAG: hypothetical protein JSS63_10650 [Bacteroidetes bacterium]|nr:hypothetical protein [Bacteroidota bacterium]
MNFSEKKKLLQENSQGSFIFYREWFSLAYADGFCPERVEDVGRGLKWPKLTRS